jgi:hypothetical protein
MCQLEQVRAALRHSDERGVVGYGLRVRTNEAERPEGQLGHER